MMKRSRSVTTIPLSPLLAPYLNVISSGCFFFDVILTMLPRARRTWTQAMWGLSGISRNTYRCVSVMSRWLKTDVQRHPHQQGKFLYSAVSSPQDRSKRFTLYFPDRLVQSDTISASLGSIQPYAAINARRLLVHISTTVYSQVLIQLNELEQCRVKKLAQGFNTAAHMEGYQGKYDNINALNQEMESLKWISLLLE